MKIFIWKRIEKCTGHYHREGGGIVFAENEERAREIANNRKTGEYEGGGTFISPEEIPDDIRETTGDEALYIFPDAGCC